MPPEELDDALGSLQMRRVAGHRMPGEESLKQVHVRVGTAGGLARRRLQITAGLAVLQMRVEEGKRLLAQPQRIRVAAKMRPGERQKHAAMVVGVLDRIGDAAVDVAACAPSRRAPCGPSRHEFESVRDQPVGRPVPAARLGNCEGIDLPSPWCACASASRAASRRSPAPRGSRLGCRRRPWSTTKAASRRTASGARAAARRR